MEIIKYDEEMAAVDAAEEIAKERKKGMKKLAPEEIDKIIKRVEKTGKIKPEIIDIEIK